MRPTLAITAGLLMLAVTCVLHAAPVSTPQSSAGDQLAQAEVSDAPIADIGTESSLRRSANKIALRRVALRLTLTGKFKQARQVRQVLDNPDMLESFVDIADSTLPHESSFAAADGTPVVDAIIKLVDYFLDHIDEIMKIVQTIINLFLDTAQLDAGPVYEPVAFACQTEWALAA